MLSKIVKFLNNNIPVAEVNYTDSAVSVNLYPRRFHVACFICFASDVGEVEVDFVPAGMKTERHRCAEVMDSIHLLEVAHAESAVHVSVVEDLHFLNSILDLD